jgi:DNA-directed RNA polymerase specialized sigma24 family protein
VTTGDPAGRPAVDGAATPERSRAPADATSRSLLVRAQAGDPAAWEALTTLYRPLLVGWLRRQGVPPGEVDDLVQEVLLGVVQSLPGFTHSGRVGAFRAWLRTIACHRTLDHFRAAGRGGRRGRPLAARRPGQRAVPAVGRGARPVRPGAPARRGE